MAPELTVIVVNWNTRDLLLTCLTSLANNVAVEHRCTVVDNGSEDGSANAVASQFPEVLLIRNETNLGFGRANNLALKQSTTDFVLLLNSDTRMEPGAIETMLELMRTDPTVGIVGPQLVNDDRSAQNSYDNYPTLATELLNKSLLRMLWPKRFSGKSAPGDQPIVVESVIGACMLLRAKALDQIGLFDEDYFFFKEETDLCLRMAKADWRVMHLPGAQVVHLQGKSKERAPLAAKIEYDRSNLVFFRKHRTGSAVALLRTGRVLKLVANVGLGAMGLLLTAGGTARQRIRVATYAGLLAWHLRGCPDGPGLRTVALDSNLLNKEI